MKAVTAHFVGNANWSIERKAFSTTKKEDKIFEARVDGILLRRHDHRIMAILEVKPFVREKKDYVYVVSSSPFHVPPAVFLFFLI